MKPTRKKMPIASAMLDTAVDRGPTSTVVRLATDGLSRDGCGASDHDHEEVSVPTTIPVMTITTLGSFDVCVQDTECSTQIAWYREEAKILLQCPAAAPDLRRSRSQLTELLWAEQTPQRAQDTLRHALTHLRMALEPHRQAGRPSAFVGSDRRTVWLMHDQPGDGGGEGDRLGRPRHGRVEVDYVRFETRAARAIALLAQEVTLLSAKERSDSERLGDEALSLYRGPFLEGQHDAPWMQKTRARCHRLWAGLVRALARVAAWDDRYDRAELLAGSLFDDCPEDEDAARRLMLIQAAAGHRGFASRTYERHCAALYTALGIRPALEIQHLMHSIRNSASLEGLQAILREERL